MKLSEYCNKKETLWYKIEQENVEKLIKYLNNNIDDDLFKIANTDNSLEVFNKLKVWLFKFYNKQLLNGLNYIEADYERFKKGLIYSLILGVTRNKSNTDLLYDILKSANIIEKMIVYDNGTYEIISKDFGKIQFMKAEDSFINDKETLDFIRKLGDKIQDGCHEISFYLIEKYEMFKKERLMMELKIMYFVHGTTVDNAVGKCSGWKQVELTDLGRERAIKLGEIQKDAGFDVIFTSDLIRAINSAKLAFPNVKHIQDERLRECNYGDLDGQDKSLVIYEEHIEKPFPNGESLKDVERRIDDFIKFLKDNYHGKKVGIVAHRAPQLAFEVLTKNISWEEANRNDWRKAKAWQPGWEYIIK